MMKTRQRVSEGYLMNRSIIVVTVVLMTAISTMAARAELLIAAVGPMSGQYAGYGQELLWGAEMAVTHINDNGGVLGKKVDLVIADDACDAEQAVAIADKIVNDGAVFVAGHYCSHSSIPAAKVYEKAGVLMISPASTNPRLTDDGGSHVFRLCGRDDQQGIVAGDYLADVWSDQKIAILHDDSIYGKGLANATRLQLQKRGISEVMYEAYTPEKTDYLFLINKLKSNSVDVFYIGGYSTEAGLMIRQARDQDYQAQLVGGDGLANEDFWLIAGSAGEGTLITFGPDPRTNPEAAAVVETFRAQGFEPVGYTLYTYAAVQVWAQAVEKAGSLELAAVTQVLHDQQFDTVLGKIGFDEKGDVTTPSYVWYIWKNGRYVPKP